MILTEENSTKMAKTIDDNDSTTIDGQQLSFRKIGGFDVLQDRPFITDDQESILIISGRKIRKYLVNNGNFINEYHFGIDAPIVTIQRNDNPNECWLAFENGQIVQWNYDENFRISEYRIPIDKNRRSTLTYYKRIDNICYFATKQRKKANQMRYTLQYYHQNDPDNLMLIDRSLSFSKIKSKNIAFGPGGHQCAIIHRNQLFVYEIPISLTSQRQIHLESESKFFTSIAFHPFEPLLATGDTNGQIHIWNNIFAKKPPKSVLHWHSQSVMDMAFSPNGTSLYSVGNEMVLVKWNLVGKNYGQKTFVPRLGDKIHFVTTDTKNKFVITSHADQSIHVIDTQMNGIRTVIEGLAFAGNRSAGLHFNRRLGAITMNGRIGHLQFYSPISQRQLFQFDITEQNVIVAPKIGKSRDRSIKNLEDIDKDNFIPIQVTRIAITDDGYWMATAEYRNDGETSPEIRLKFWLLQKANNGFALNTTVHLPHEDDINFMQFSLPPPKQQQRSFSPLHLVTTSMDKTFKIWDLKTSSTDGKQQWWNCSRNGSLNNHSIPRMASFAPDASLLTVLFGSNLVTMWELNGHSSIRYIPRMDIFNIINNSDDQQQKSIDNNHHIIYVGFGQKNFAHYLIEGHRQGLIVRNVVRKFQTIFEYRIDQQQKNVLPIDSIVAERGENILALIALDSIRFLCLRQQRVIAFVDLSTMKNFRGTIVSSVFWPSEMVINNDDDDGKGDDIFNRNYLCITDQNELFQAIPMARNNSGENILDDYSQTIMVGSHRDLRTEIFIRNLDQQNNRLAPLMAANKNDGDDEKSNKQQSLDTEKSAAELIEKYFYNIPSHVLPPVMIMEKSFLSDYLKTLQLSSSSPSTAMVDNEKKVVDQKSDESSSNHHHSDNKTDFKIDNQKLKFESNQLIDENGDNPIKGNDFFWLEKYIRTSSLLDDNQTIDGAVVDSNS